MKYKKILAIIVICLLLVGCCIHEQNQIKRIEVHKDTAICVDVQPLLRSTEVIYKFKATQISEPLTILKRPEEIMVPITPSKNYEVSYSYLDCPDCIKKGNYNIKNAVILKELED